MQIKPKLILVTSGEPSGVGPDICLNLAQIEFGVDYIIVVIGSIELLQERARLLNKSIEFISFDVNNYLSYTNQLGKLLVLNIFCPNINCIAKAELSNVRYVINILDLAINLCNKGLSSKIVTAPVSKEIINQAGLDFSGHTEYLANRFQVDRVVMMLANRYMKVALLTTHLPLLDVPKHVTVDNLNQVLATIVEFFNTKFSIPNPKIAVCGLNPHAGEGGFLGIEEIRVINPVVKEWQNKGFNVSGSYSADTIFNHAHKFDVILAMYHDQGLPVLKYSDFDSGVNVTLGLPIVRTSVDHGTAFDLAGTGLAKSESLISAIQFAIACN